MQTWYEDNQLLLLFFVKRFACCFKMTDRGDLFINIVSVILSFCLLVDSKECFAMLNLWSCIDDSPLILKEYPPRK